MAATAWALALLAALAPTPAHKHRHRHRRRGWHHAAASEFSPPDAGAPLACTGRDLTYSDVVVANKTLPCGTRVTFRVGRREASARVEDRGPYAAGRMWDLSWKLARNLGLVFPWSGTITWTYG